MDSPHSAPFVFGGNAQAGHAFVPPSASPDPKVAFSTFSPGAPVFGASSPLSPSTFASTPSPVFQFGSQVPTFGAPSSPYASPSSGQEAPFVFGGAAQQLPAVSPVRGAATRKKVVVARKSPAPSPSVTSLPSSPFAASSSPFSPTTTASPPPFVFGAASPALDTGKGKEKDTPVSPFDLSKRGGEKKGSKGKQPSHGRVVQEQQAFEFKPQLQQEDGRKIVRARRGEAPKANKLTAEAAAGRKIIKARRGAAKAQGQPSGQARGRACLRHSDLFLRHKVGTNQKTLPMSDSLVVKGYTPNGKYLLTYSTHDGIQHRMWYLWREDDTLKTIHDLKWYGFLPGELLFLTNEFIIFLVLGEDGYPVVVQYTLLDMDLALKRDFGAVRGRVKLHDKTELKPLELCKTLGAQAVFAGLLDEQAILGVVVSTGRERETLVTTYQINPTGLTELGVVQLPAGMYSSPSHLAVHSFPEAHHFMVTYEHTDDPQDQSVLFALHPPTVKEPVRVTHKTLNEDERKHCATFLEPRVKVVNLAGVVLQMPHPTRPLDIISEDVVSATQPGFSLEEFLDFSGDFPEVDFHGTHDRAMSYRVDDSEGEDDDDDDEDDEDDDDEDEGQYEDDTDEEDYPASEYDYFAGRGGHQSGNEVGGQFSRMSMNEEDSLDNVD